MRSDDFVDLEELLGELPDLEPGSVLEDDEDYPADDAAEEDVDGEDEASEESTTGAEEDVAEAEEDAAEAEEDAAEAGEGAAEAGEGAAEAEEDAAEAEEDAAEAEGDAAEPDEAAVEAEEAVWETEDLPEADGTAADMAGEEAAMEAGEIAESEPDEFDDIDEAMQAGREDRKKRKIPIPLIIVLVVCVAVFGVAVWQLSNIFIQYNAAENEYEDLLQYVNSEIDETDEDTYEEDSEDEEDDETVERVALSLLKAQNSDTVGWIEIPGTVISYPLMHTTDNSYYLNHTFSGKVNSSGCIFVETLNSGDFTDLHTIIYGHNMKNGSMFAILKNYASASYLVAHPIIYIDLEDGTHAYQIFSVHSASSDDASFTIGFVADEEYEAFLEYLKDSSDYDTGVTVSVDDYIITLSTCTNSGQDRYLVHAKKLY